MLGMKDTVERTVRVLESLVLPTRLPEDADLEKLVEVMQHDKKARDGKLVFVLLEDVGRPVVRSDVDLELVKRVLGEMIG